jgi:hypothetical protein
MTGGRFFPRPPEGDANEWALAEETMSEYIDLMSSASSVDLTKTEFFSKDTRQRYWEGPEGRANLKAVSDPYAALLRPAGQKLAPADQKMFAGMSNAVGRWPVKDAAGELIGTYIVRLQPEATKIDPFKQIFERKWRIVSLAFTKGPAELPAMFCDRPGDVEAYLKKKAEKAAKAARRGG